MPRVVVFGVFDILHPGHLFFLREACKKGDCLTVIITRDARVIQEKKRAPIFNERERLEIIQEIKSVDYAILGDKVGEWKVLKKLKPDIICIGYDQKAEWIKKSGLEKLPKIIKIRKYKNYSSRNIR